MSSKPEGAKFTFTVKIPNLQDPKPSEGLIKNLTAAQNLTISVPKRSGGNNGKKTVNILPPSVNNTNFLFIRPDAYSDDCRKLTCTPGPASSSATSTSTDTATHSDDSTQTSMDYQKPGSGSGSSDTGHSTNPFIPKPGGGG